MFGLRAAPDAKYWRRLRSVQLMIIGAAFSGIASVLGVLGGLQLVQDHPFAFLGVAAVVNVLALGSRLIDQPSVPNA
jgi:hypothetical protein